MLTVAKVTQGSAAGYADYLEGKAHATELGDYYLKDGERVEAPGRWAGGAGAVGCDPTANVSREQLRSLMAVRRPDTGSRLRQVGGSGEAVAALDATFSAPKSVSAVWAVAGPGLRGRVEWAHEQAIDRALIHSVQRVAMVRHRIDPNTVVHRKPAGVVATSWRHTTARSVDGRPPDPQLHSRVLLHAAVRRDGRVVAIDSRSWLVHQREVGAAYRTELARELSRLGFGIERGTGRGGRYFEITGVPTRLLDRWSGRHQQVHAAIQHRLAQRQAELAVLVTAGGPVGQDAAKRLSMLRETGQLAPAEERYMSTSTRSPKTPATHRDLDMHWNRAGSELGLSAGRITQLRSPDPVVLVPASRGRLLDVLTEFDATFPAWDARAIALEASAGLPIAEALDALADLRASGELLRLQDGTGTTLQLRNREHATVAIAQRLAGHTAPPLPARVVTEQADRLDAELRERGARLSSEQRQALVLACGERRLVVIEGQAGTGKSTTLTGIARAHQQAGREIILTSTAALAAQRLARDLDTAGVNTNAYSIAALHTAIQMGQLELGPNTTVIHDEAALASTREQHQLLEAVDESGARLIEVGDPRQNQAVGAGGLWPHLETAARDAGAHTELTRNQRAHDPADRRDQARFRAGQHRAAIRGYAARDRVHHRSGQDQAEDAALDAAHHDRRAGQRTIVIAQTSNDHLDELNARAQAIRHQHRELGPEFLPLPGRPYQLHPGDEIQIRRNVTHPQHGPLRNGTTGQVGHIDPTAETIDLELADGQRVTLNRADADRADLRLAYVQHPFPAQGHTTDTAHLIVAEHTTQEGAYVALTRARQQTHLYAPTPAGQPAETDRLEVLAEQLSRTEPDLPSIHTPLAHEHAITTDHDRSTQPRDATTHPQHPELSPSQQTEPRNTPQPHIYQPLQVEVEPPRVGLPTYASVTGDANPLRGPDPQEATRLGAATFAPPSLRHWPSTNPFDPVEPVHQLDLDEAQPGRTPRWEP